MLLFYCGVLPIVHNVDQRRILFYKKLKCHSSTGYAQKFVILKFCQSQTSIIFIVWTCLLARSDAVSGRYLLTA